MIRLGTHHYRMPTKTLTSARCAPISQLRISSLRVGRMVNMRTPINVRLVVSRNSLSGSWKVAAYFHTNSRVVRGDHIIFENKPRSKPINANPNQSAGTASPTSAQAGADGNKWEELINNARRVLNTRPQTAPKKAPRPARLFAIIVLGLLFFYILLKSTQESKDTRARYAKAEKKIQAFTEAIEDAKDAWEDILDALEKANGGNKAAVVTVDLAELDNLVQKKIFTPLTEVTKPRLRRPISTPEPTSDESATNAK